MASDTRRLRARVAELLDMVGLLPDMADRYPHEFSGGQRQRIGIARALALDPSADHLRRAGVGARRVDPGAGREPVQELQERLGLTYIFIAHDLAVVRHISDRIAVMYLGRIVEIAPARRALRQAAASLHPGAAGRDPDRRSRGRGLRGRSRSSPARCRAAMRPPPGCRFHTRCPKAMDVCKSVDPPMRDMGGGRAVACHLYD